MHAAKFGKLALHLLDIFDHDVLDFSHATPHSVDRICIGIVGKVAHALLQDAAKLCIILIRNSILCCFWAICCQELVLNVVQKGKWDSAP